MGPAYLFALVVGFGILLVQALLGSKDAEGGADTGADADADAGELHADGGHDAIGADKELGPQGADGHADKDLADVGGLAALLLSTRFWIFAFLGFGLSGTLLHYLFGTISGVATLATAIVAGLLSGLAAAAAFRVLRKTSSKTATDTTTAVGKLARVLVPCSKDSVGQVRILLDGQAVDMSAKTTELRIERGDYVVIEEVDGDVAQVSKAPPELGH